MYYFDMGFNFSSAYILPVIELQLCGFQKYLLKSVADGQPYSAVIIPEGNIGTHTFPPK
jgi:hypothetical protein